MTEYKLAVIVTGVLQLYTLLMTEIIFRFVKALAVFEHVSKSMRRVSRSLSHGVPRIVVVLFPLFLTRFFAYVSSSEACCSELKFFTLLCHLCKTAF